MRQKPPANKDLDEDQALWQRVTQRLTPLRGRGQPLPSSPAFKKRAKPSKSPTKASIINTSPASSFTAILKPSSPVDLRMGDRAGIDGRTQRRLFRGDVPIERRLDLHGHTAACAEIILHKFIEDAFYGGCRCVLVISGKGAGVIKGHVPEWLKRPPLSGLVLALAEARPSDGGSGALYVLLKRRRR